MRGSLQDYDTLISVSWFTLTVPVTLLRELFLLPFIFKDFGNSGPQPVE